MSQIYKSLISGPVPPSVATSYVTQKGTAVPSANTLIVFGEQSTENNNSGIIVKGGVVGTGTSNEVDVVLTNRVTGQITTSDATPTTIITLDMGLSAGVMCLQGTVEAYDITDTAGAVYSFTSGLRTTGGAGIEIATQSEGIFVETSMATATIDINASGNNVVVIVTGIAGKTINWDAFFTYRFVS